LGESQVTGPCLYLRHPLVTTELNPVLSAADRHHAIVESATATVQRVWPNEAATLAFAQHWASNPALGQAFIALHGDLGAGKTTLVRHLLHALGVQGRIKSPTYAVVEPYTLDAREPALDIWHFDFYRFSDPREWEDAGFRDIFASPGLKLAEWPEKAAGVLPTADIDLHLRTLDDERRAVTLVAHTAVGQALLQDLPGNANEAAA
jgi:tRNA threonylcarbamoyladenosine biosynthesis protein TsaE